MLTQEHRDRYNNLLRFVSEPHEHEYLKRGGPVQVHGILQYVEWFVFGGPVYSDHITLLPGWWR
jgi:hypothetical protein